MNTREKQELGDDFGLRKVNQENSICMTNSEIMQKQIILRDKLTENENLRRGYELIKLKNHKDKDIDSSDYALAKSDFIQR